MGYSNEINPFGDSNLLQPFVWGKKVEKKRETKRHKHSHHRHGHAQDSSSSEEEDEDARRINLMKDIDRVRKRREAREKELEDMEKARADELRLREAVSYGDWEEKEEEFHREQTKVRSKIRLLDHRERPIDLLAKNILLIEAEAAINRPNPTTHGTPVVVDETEADIAQSLSYLQKSDITDPVFMVEHLSGRNLRQLQTDVESYLELEQEKKIKSDSNSISSSRGSDNSDYLLFWQCLLNVINAELVRLDIRSRDDDNNYNNSSSSSSSSSRTGAAEAVADSTHRAIQKEVDALLTGKSATELEHLHSDIQRGLREGAYGDTEYWEAVARGIDTERNRVIVRSIFADLMVKKKAAVQSLRRRVSAASASSGGVLASTSMSTSVVNSYVYDDDGVDTTAAQRLAASRRGLGAIAVDDMFSERQDPYAEFSPEERAVLRQMDAAEAEAGSGGGMGGTDGEGEEVATSERMKGADEVALPVDSCTSAGAGVGAARYSWADRFAPRKPRFFNRVKTGYSWNRYNKTHYSRDNPPPRMIFGYKFTLFYPDLIDKSETPKFYMSAASEPEFAIIRFHAGPPYEDVAFKIVNKEWNKDRRAGFRLTFDRGVLQLHFNFKHHIYKR